MDVGGANGGPAPFVINPYDVTKGGGANTMIDSFIILACIEGGRGLW